MRFSKYFLTILFLACSILAHAQKDTVLTLQQCLDIAIKNNLNVKQFDLTMEQDRIGLNQAKENLLPSITGSASRELSQGRSINPVTNTYVNQSLTSDNYGVSASLTLFNGLALQNAIKQAAFNYQAGRMDFQQAKDQVTINIITAYLSVLDADEILEQSKSQLAVAKENVNISEIKEKDGANLTASTLSDFQGAYASSEVAVVQNQNALDAAKLNLYNLMNIPYNKDSKLQSLNAQDLVGQYGANADQVYNTALQQLSIVKAAVFRRESAEKAVKVAQGQLLPTLAVNGGISTNYSSADQKSVLIDSTVVPTGAYINTPASKRSFDTL